MNMVLIGDVINNTSSEVCGLVGGENLDVHIKCPLCHNLIYEPKTLPCQHSFCFRCLHAWGLKNFYNQRGCECAVCGRVFPSLSLNQIMDDEKKNFYNQRGCECAVCGRVFPSLSLNQIMDDEKVIILQQMAKAQNHSSLSSSAAAATPLKGILKKAPRDIEEEEMMGVDSAAANGLQSAPGEGSSRLDELLGLNSDEEADMNDLDSSGDSSLEDDEIDGEFSQYLSSDDSTSEEEQDMKSPRPLMEVVQDLFNDDQIDHFRFSDIFLNKLQIVKTVDIRTKKELKEPFVHDMSMTRDGNLFVVDINNNLVKCCDSEGLTLKKTPKKLTFKPIRICELYSGELLVVEMTKHGTGKLSALKRSLTNKDATNKRVIRSVKKICVVRQMPEDRQRFYCGDSLGFVHRMNLKNPETYHKFHSVLPRVYHLAAANSLVAVNDGNLDGATSKIVRIFDEDGNLQWSYSGTVNHPFQYHGDMVFHGDYLIICDFWASKLHILFLPNETPAVILDLKRDLGLVFPSAILTTREHRLVLAAQTKTSKKNLIYTLEYLHDK